jgi:hypothetical protein
MTNGSQEKGRKKEASASSTSTAERQVRWTLLMASRKKIHFFQVRMPDADMRKLQKLARLEGEGMSAIVRSAIRREYAAKIEVKR